MQEGITLKGNGFRYDKTDKYAVKLKGTGCPAKSEQVPATVKGVSLTTIALNWVSLDSNYPMAAGCTNVIEAELTYKESSPVCANDENTSHSKRSAVFSS